MMIRKNYVVAFIIALFFTTIINAQNNKGNDNTPDGLKKIITVDFQDESFSNILKKMGELTGIKFNYSSRNIPQDTKLTLHEENLSAKEILEKLVEMTGTKLIYTADSQVIITKKQQPSISGRVTDSSGGFSLIGANVVLEGLPYGAATDVEGNFAIENLDEGNYSVLCRYIGYETKVIENVKVRKDAPVFLNIVLEEEAVSLSEITVTPGAFGLMNRKSMTVQTLTKEDIQNMSFGEDVYRAITRIPGVSSNDFSSRFNIRGGESDEILVTLDGMTLIEPFHMKDINGGIFSIVDAAVIGEANILAGAFPAEYGDKMSGVFTIKSLNPVDTKDMISASISMMNARLMGQGTFNDKKGSWILSARRGYLDFILERVKEDNTPQPTYYDIYGKADYWLDQSNRLSVNFLYGGDSFKMNEDDFDTTKTKYANASAWLTYDRIWSDKFTSQTVAFINTYSHSRKGLGRDEDTQSLDFRVRDDRKYSMYGIKHNMQYDLSENLLLKMGMEFSQSDAEYDYYNTFRQEGLDENLEPFNSWKNNQLQLNPVGSKFSSYISARFNLSNSLVGEIGGRYDQTSYTDDKLFSPRINLAWTITPRTFLRAGFGYFYQTQDIQSIRVQNGETGYNKAELAKHYMVGIEHSFENGFSIRLEGYYKKLTDLKLAYRNAGHTIELFPEVQWDMLKLKLDYAEARGLEMFVKYDQGGFFSMWGSYAYAVSEETVSSVTNINGVQVFNDKMTIPKPYDQTHTVNLDLNFRPGNNWHINLAWQYRGGWPYTERLLGEGNTEDGGKYYYIYWGDFQGGRYPAYHRLDLRISKYFLTDYGKFDVFLEFMNVYANDNIRNYVFRLRGSEEQGYYLKRKEESWLPFIPSIGVRWDLDL